MIELITFLKFLVASLGGACIGMLIAIGLLRRVIPWPAQERPADTDQWGA